MKDKNKGGRMAKNKVAIFDIDGTVFRSSLLIELTDALITAEIFPSKAGDVYKKSHKRWKDREGTYEDYIQSVIHAFERNIKGVKRADFMRVAKDVIAENQSQMYTFTRDLIGRLRARGYYLLAISHSPKEVVEEFTKTLGFDKTYGWMYDVDTEGVFTGHSLYLDEIVDKAKILKRATAKDGLSLAGSVGVGDTQSDVAFLKMVETSICFNPNKKLYNVAKKNGWSVVIERKDVVYEL
jgi:HAD superfamily hydrolase (TIGR01490 family)